MSLPGVNVVIGNGALGAVAVGEYGVVGIIMSGVAVTGGIGLLDPKQIFNLDEAVALGIDSNYDVLNDVDAYRHIKEFYDEAGSGAELWIMLVSPTVFMATIADKTEANYAVKLIGAAQGRIRILAITRRSESSYVPSIVEGLDGDVWTAMTNAQALAEEYTNNNNPIRVLIQGVFYPGIAANLKNLKQAGNNRVAVMIGSTSATKHACVGVLCGRLAKDPIKRNPGRVKSGSLAINEAYLGTVAVEDSESEIGVIHSKGIITLRTISGKAGYFFTDAPMATSDTDDYSTLPAGRVVDAAHLIAYRTFMNEVLDEVEVDDNGYIQPAIVKGWEASIVNAVTGDIGNQMSKFEAEIDPRQNVLAVPTISVKLSITPVGYAKSFEIELGFNNPFN